jgi:2-(1,2-epoxy-1,2-dihydrophenyl)acetyl-CoA isomerase
MTDYRTILYASDGGVARILFNRPEARNSLIDLSAAEFADALDRTARDPQVRVLLVRGNGRDFCPGADIKAFNTDPAIQAEHDQAKPEYFTASALLHEMPAVTIAAIQGGCAGAGMGYACACDIRIADETARFNTAFLNVGVAGDMGLPWSLPRLIGAARARDLSFLPRKFDSVEALAMGLIARRFDSKSFDGEVEGILSYLTGVAPLALKRLKANYLAAEKLGLTDYIALETERHLELFATEDRVEAFAAFAEKRPGRFHGK